MTTLFPGRFFLLLATTIAVVGGGLAAPVEWAASLRQPPAIHPAPDHSAEGVQAVFFDGLPFEGKPTRVFAFYHVPERTSAEPVPGMVLVHGGGGTAFAAWVRQWNARGYAAIALDTGGNVPAKTKEGRERHAWAGPVDGGASIARGEKPLEEQWMFHAVAHVMRAHSLLAAQPGVDASRIGLTGISWGGIVTSVVAGVDARFRVAVPVYGCGFLEESEVFRPQIATPAGQRWRALWDPSHYLPHAAMPMAWVNGTNDRFFHVEPWQRSGALAPGTRTRVLLPGMRHSHPAGWEPPEIGWIVDSVLKDGAPLPAFDAVEIGAGSVAATVRSALAITGAQLHVTTDATGPASQWTWQSHDAAWDAARRRVTATLPANTAKFFLSVTDERGARSSSALGQASHDIPPRGTGAGKP